MPVGYEIVVASENWERGRNCSGLVAQAEHDPEALASIDTSNMPWRRVLRLR